MKEANSGEDLLISDGPKLSLSAWCVVAAFGTYFCMYAFRKPFTAAGYGDVILWGVGYKTVLVTAQVLGYTLSKFLGIKVVAEARPHRRVILLLGLIAAAEAALLLFGLTPAPFNFIWLFCNGLPLGLVFGLVLGILEGRHVTEALAAGLCSSFIVADGVVKSAVADPVRLHVAAKRYLCAVEPDYNAGLSAASQRSLRLQGGLMSQEEVRHFEQEPWFRSVLAVRRWDDAAKVPGLVVPGLEHYRACLESVLVVASTE